MYKRQTIQRDIEDIRAFLDNKSGGKETLLYDRSSNRYRIVLNDDSHPVSYTHLDVYKRQEKYCIKFAKIDGKCYN